MSHVPDLACKSPISSAVATPVPIIQPLHRRRSAAALTPWRAPPALLPHPGDCLARPPELVGATIQPSLPQACVVYSSLPFARAGQQPKIRVMHVTAELTGEYSSCAGGVLETSSCNALTKGRSLPIMLCCGKPMAQKHIVGRHHNDPPAPAIVKCMWKSMRITRTSQEAQSERVITSLAQGSAPTSPHRCHVTCSVTLQSPHRPRKCPITTATMAAATQRLPSSLIGWRLA